MGGTGSGRRTPRSKKTSATSKFTSNLTSLGFANGLNKQGVTPATTNDYPEKNHSNVITPNKDPLPDPATLPPSGTKPPKLNLGSSPNSSQVTKAPIKRPMMPIIKKPEEALAMTTHKIKIQYQSRVQDKNTDVVKKCGE